MYLNLFSYIYMHDNPGGLKKIANTSMGETF